MPEPRRAHRTRPNRALRAPDPNRSRSPEAQRLEQAVGRKASALDFLKSQKYEKQANFDKVLPTLDRVIRGSGFITVIL